MPGAQRTVRNEEDKTSFSLGRSAESFVVSLQSDQLAQPEGTVSSLQPIFFLKASSGKRGLGRFHDWTWGCRDCCILHGLGSQRVAGEEKYQVPSSSFWGVVSCKRAASSLVPRVCLSSSSTVFVFICLRLRHSGVSSAVRELPLRSSPECVCLRSSSSTVSVFVCLSLFACLRLRLSPSSSVSVAVPGSWSRGRRLSVRCSTSRVWKPPWRACSQCVQNTVCIP